jgi:hypothetical protein
MIRQTELTGDDIIVRPGESYDSVYSLLPGDLGLQAVYNST